LLFNKFKNKHLKNTPMKQFFTFLALVVFTATTYAQVGIGTTNPDPSAALDITSTTKGLLVPRMTQAQRNAISSPATWLIVICTDCGNSGELQVYNGTTWTNMIGGTATIPNVTSTTGRIWMDRNLGASQVATSSTDTASYGDLYQWGRGADGHQTRTSSTTSTLSSADQPADGDFISASVSPKDWRSPQNGNLWQGVNGVNNPCPSGYRIPTEAEWATELSSWSTSDSYGAFASPLKLTVAGNRSSSNGGNYQAGSQGFYWSSSLSSASSSNKSRLFQISGFSAGFNNIDRAMGSSCRCIKD
jgi:uncharacterized protein (TIGR02145 family)